MAPQHRSLLKGLILLLGLGVLGYAFQQGAWSQAFNETWIDDHVRNAGLMGILLFLGVGGVLTAIGLPRQVVAFFGGYAFAVLLGTLLAALAALLGCLLTFTYARAIGSQHVKRWAENATLERWAYTHPLAMTILLRLLPVGSNFLLNIAAGLSQIRALPFFAGSFIGYLPQTLIFALVGHGVRVDPVVNTLGAILLFLVSALIGLWLYRRLPARGR